MSLRQSPTRPPKFAGISDHHACYFAHELTRHAAQGIDQLSASLFDAAVDLNPHQIEAALYFFRSPTVKGVLLADEVGLGKTIEASLILGQLWAEKKRRLLIVCPASLRKQWSLELREKFNLPSFILDARSYALDLKSGNPSPVSRDAVVIVSYQYARKIDDQLRSIPWDVAVIDEAHKLRGCYRAKNRLGQSILRSLGGVRKVLLSATPLQNSLLELYGLSKLIDDDLFGDLATFRSHYTGKDADPEELRARLRSWTKRTLRRDVLEYIRYTERKPLTVPFQPAENEQKLYEAVSTFLQRADSYALPQRQRELTTLVIRKLLASSSYAVAGTLETIRQRLVDLRAGLDAPVDLAEQLVAEDDLSDDYLDEAEELIADEQLAADGDEPADANGVADPDSEPALTSPPPSPSAVSISSAPSTGQTPAIDRERLDREITEMDLLITWARSVQLDEKTRALVTALRLGFEQLASSGARRKAVIFTESRRTQEYLKRFLEATGYLGKVVLFNGSLGGSAEAAIYERWETVNRPLGRLSGSRVADRRQAILEHFRDEADILLATESAAEGINLQFCSLVINYDLPWNPQRVEQRIGRCHRYGQTHDVVVINFLNQANAADQRVLELLTEKFQLFRGVFGASDEVLGSIESGIDFEKRVLRIYQDCRTPAEIDAAFKRLREEMDASIQARMASTRREVLENFDEDVSLRLRDSLTAAEERLDRVSRAFWRTTRHLLRDNAAFDDTGHTFRLDPSPIPGLQPGPYHLVAKPPRDRSDAVPAPAIPPDFIYRLTHPLGDWVLASGKALSPAPAAVTFDVSGYGARLAAVEPLRGKSGWLILQKLAIESLGTEEHLLFSGFDDAGAALDQETLEKLFHCDLATGTAPAPVEFAPSVSDRLTREARRHAEATLSSSLERNNTYFREERDKLEKWADDALAGAERALSDTKEQIKALTRQARTAPNTEAQHEIQQRIVDLEKKKRRQRQQIFDVEDEILGRRDTLIGDLEKRLAQRTSTQPLFVLRWSVV
jgi:hypothetical protein